MMGNCFSPSPPCVETDIGNVNIDVQCCIKKNIDEIDGENIWSCVKCFKISKKH